MIRVLIMYPNEEGKRFDWEYYLNNHKALVHEKLDGLGLARIEADRGIGTAQPDAPAPYVAVGHLYYNTMEDFQRCMSCSDALMADIPNFTDIQPQIQISEVL